MAMARLECTKAYCLRMDVDFVVHSCTPTNRIEEKSHDEED